MAKKLKSIYIDIEQFERLNRLSARTGVTKSDYIREAFDLILKKGERHLDDSPQKKTIAEEGI